MPSILINCPAIPFTLCADVISILISLGRKGVVLDIAENCDAPKTGWVPKVVVYTKVKRKLRIPIKSRVIANASLSTEPAKLSLLAVKYSFNLDSLPQIV